MGNNETDNKNSGESSLQTATFAGGCFWCMVAPFEQLKGVKSVMSGYTGGEKENPKYEEVASGQTKHAEAVEIIYDPEITKFEELLEIFWQSIDPTQMNGQFADQGRHYRTSIFYHNDKQKQIAEKSKKDLADSGKFDKPIVTEIVAATKFYNAEEYHQKYYQKNPEHYNRYRHLSGRGPFLEKIWGKKK